MAVKRPRLDVIVVGLVLAAVCVALVIWIRHRVPSPGRVRDEALSAGRAAATFPAAYDDDDFFRDMDRNVPPDGGPPAALKLTFEEQSGRNTWLVWTGGDDRMWDQLSGRSLGALDLLKTISTHDRLPNGRHNRWSYLGVVNEPCFEASTKSEIGYRWGLRVDRRGDGCKPDPFEDAVKYPGVRLGGRGETLKWRGRSVPLEIGSYYGYATGIVGLRLFPNPAFDQAAADEWDPEKYYSDAGYYNRRTLIKPYRVGMSCAFCHAGPNPINPPADANAPRWENLSSNVGAQYFRVDRVMYWRTKPDDFVFQLFHTSRPGTLDTSFISTDHINNPRSMNAIYHLLPRMEQARRWGQETLAGGSLGNRQFNDILGTGPLAQFFQAPSIVWTPRVLKDGADSVGALGALNRVYLSIGVFSEEWLLHFNPLIGGTPVSPIPIGTARENSAYFKATEAHTPNVARFFLRTTAPHRLKDAPGGIEALKQASAPDPADPAARGKKVFADHCARCHSSKIPEAAHPILQPGGCAGKDYLKCWNSYWELTKTDGFKRRMEAIVSAPDFLDDNYLSTDLRVPITLLQTNACSSLASNATAGHIWDNFSSQSYKDLPSVGEITWFHPYSGEPRIYKMPAGGRGYTRPPSLISLWSTAPFLLNNSVGRFEDSPSVEARLRSFHSSIEQMLWPARRDKDERLPGIPGAIDRVGGGTAAVRPARNGEPRKQDAYLYADGGVLPPRLLPAVRLPSIFFPRLFPDGSLTIGPIPAATPIGLLSNIDLLGETDGQSRRRADPADLLELVKMARRPLDLQGGSDASKDAIELFLRLSKCPDLIVNRGHNFGSDLDDSDKRALIAFLMTF